MNPYSDNVTRLPEAPLGHVGAPESVTGARRTLPVRAPGCGANIQIRLRQLLLLSGLPLQTRAPNGRRSPLAIHLLPLHAAQDSGDAGDHSCGHAATFSNRSLATGSGRINTNSIHYAASWRQRRLWGFRCGHLRNSRSFKGDRRLVSQCPANAWLDVHIMNST